MRLCTSQKPECDLACPLPYPHGAGNNRSSPAATWKRGDLVSVGWVKNNHRGGFVAISLVPVSNMFNKTWHETLTLMMGCWEYEQVDCNVGEDCGTDLRGIALRRIIRVPSVYPDGDYALRYVWFGGLIKTGKRGFFPDFSSCTFVRIEGGDEVGGSFRPYFDAGIHPRIINGTCPTSASELGICNRVGCKKTKKYYAVPTRFNCTTDREESRYQDSITSDLIASAAGDETELSLYDVETDEKNGICKGRVCCPVTCGGCGGKGCEYLPGGEAECCRLPILGTERACTEYRPPCVVRVR